VAISPGVVFAQPTPYATSFPQVIGTASSFNATLWAAIGAAVSTEARAFSNVGHAGLTFWAPNLNIFRDPRWGRGQETPGEDPLLNGDYTAAYVRALQGLAEDDAQAPPSGGPLKVSACCKHFDAYSLESWGGVERYGFDALVAAQDLADTYLPAFRQCVIEGGASCIMCAYNAVNGVPMCANKPFLTDLARDAWGFDGYITSDCDAVENVLDPHNYTRTLPETIGVVMDAGLDIDCGSSMQREQMQEAMSEGYVHPSQVDAALSRLFRVQFRLGMFDPAARQPLRSVGPRSIDTAAHRALALEAARQSFVLLKNEGGALPLARGAPAAGAAPPRVALIGPHGNATSALQSNYFGIAPFLITPLDGIARFAPGVVFAPGCLDVLCANSSGFAPALAAAASADIIILAVGLSLDVEREGMDRVNLTLPGMQPDLVAAVLDAAPAGATVVMVLLCGGGVDVSAQVADARLQALLWVGYPGQAGGTAIAEALWGAHPPAGRLTQTWYPADFAEQVSMFDMGMRPNASAGTPGRGHRFYTGAPVFPFGAGLSYSTFSLAWGAGGAPDGVVSPAAVTRQLPALRIDAVQKPAPAHKPRRLRQLPRVLSASVVVTNTGAVAAPRVVLAFVAPPPQAVAQYGAPQQALVWYGRTPTLRPGGSATLAFTLTARELSFAGPDGLPMAFEGDWQLRVDGLNATLTVGAPPPGNATGALRQPRYRQHDWAAISGAHSAVDSDAAQRGEQRAAGFSQPMTLPGTTRRR
jgi:beta-D-xylosidase 4